MAERFAKAVVLITGALGALGSAMARNFAAEGASVILTDAQENDGSLIAELGVGCRFVPLDVTDADAWHAAVEKVEADVGPVTVLVNNAGIVGMGGIEDLALENWRKVFDINLIGSLLGIRAVAPSMRKAGGGAIVNISSMAGLQATPGLAAYGASKWAIRSLTKTAAAELAPDNIRVNSVHPGIVETPMAYHPETGEPHIPVDSLPIARNADPNEIARMVLFIASEATFSTGSEFIADGGYALRGVPGQK